MVSVVGTVPFELAYVVESFYLWVPNSKFTHIVSLLLLCCFCSSVLSLVKLEVLP